MSEKLKINDVSPLPASQHSLQQFDILEKTFLEISQKLKTYKVRSKTLQYINKSSKKT